MRFQTRLARGLQSSRASMPPVRKRSYQRLKVERGMPSFSSVRRADRCDCSTRRMISSFSDAGYLILRRPHLRSCFFENPQCQRLLGDDLLEIARLLAQHLHLVAGGGARRVAGEPLLASFEEFLRPVVVQALGDPAAQRGNRLLAAQALEHDADLLFSRILLAGRSADVLIICSAGAFP